MKPAKQKQRFAAALLGLAALAFVRHQNGLHPPTKPTRTPPDLVFDPPRVVYDRVFPGKYTGTFHLKNNSQRTIRDIKVQTSCFCVTLRDASFAVLKPGESVAIPYKIDVLTPGTINQAVTVSVAGEQREYHAPLRGEAILPLPEAAQNSLALAELPRESAGQKTQTVVVKTAVVPEADAVTLEPGADWLHIASRRQGSQMEFVVSADGNAPEGDFTIPAKLLYSAQKQKHDLSFAITGRIVSQVTAEPAVLSFGLVSVGQQPVPLPCTVTAHHATAQPVTFVSDNPHVQVKLLGQEADKVCFAVSLQAPKAGEIQSRITLKQAGKTLATVPVFAFVGQQTALAVPPQK